MALRDRTLRELTDMYNAYASSHGHKPLKNFPSKETAIGRYRSLLAKVRAAGSRDSRMKPRLYDAGSKIVVVVDHNPMRKGKRSYEQFEVLNRANGKTVEEYINAFKKTALPAALATATLRWCAKRELVELH